jgi:hypothetical protein
VALPRPVPARRVFRPTRRVSWGTRILAGLIGITAIAATAAFVGVVLPGRVADLGSHEGVELAAARSQAATVQASLSGLLQDIDPSGPFALASDRLASDLALSRATEKQASEALAHAQAAGAYLNEAAGVPFQLHQPAFLRTDRPAAAQLQSGLQAALKLAHAVTLQLTLAQTVAVDEQAWNGQLVPALASRSWAPAARAAASLQTQLKSEQLGAANPDALLDPLWGKWIDARYAYALTAQSYALNQASGQTITARDLQATLNTQAGQIQAALAAAQRHLSAWDQQAIAPLLQIATR